MDFEYIPGKINISADALSRLSNNGNKETTDESMYTTETMSELYGIDELPDSTFPLYFKLIYHYQQEYTFLPEKLKCAKYKKGYFRGVRNTIKLVT